MLGSPVVYQFKSRWVGGLAIEDAHSNAQELTHAHTQQAADTDQRGTLILIHNAT